MVAWLDQYSERVLLAYRGETISRPGALQSVAPSGLPWGALTTRELLRVFCSETWDGQLDVNEFGRMLQRLLGLNSVEGSRLSMKLFPGLDRDGNGLLDFREVESTLRWER